jgi:type II secretory pathway component PulJ
MGLIEVMIALMLITLGSVAVLGAILTSQRLDRELAERDLALKAVVVQMERVLSFSHDIPGLQATFADPANSNFIVDDLSVAGRGPGQGTITVTQVAPGELNIEVAVAWTGIRGPRRVSAPMYLSETIP